MKNYKIQQVPTTAEFERLVQDIGSRTAALAFWQKGIHSEKSLKKSFVVRSLLPIGELYDLSSFYKKLKPHIEKKNKIAIYGDYDADGALAASILWRFLSKKLKLPATIYIPDRHEEGYGMNKNALLKLDQQGFSLVITVDCGVRDSLLIKEVMSETHLEILITDHHQPGEDFPEVPTVHPLHPEKKSQNLFTSGGVVAWKVVRYLEREMNLGNSFSDSLIDLAGISLVTDIMPIKGENKLILKMAIDKMRNNPVLGIGAIMEHAQIKRDKLSTYHIGYMIGPRLNASGRIGDQYASARLLCSDKKDYVYRLSQEIHQVNTKRQDITKKIFEEAEDVKIILEQKLMIAFGEGWDDGIIGLVAGRLMNKYDFPTIAITIDRDKNEAKGSARSFGEFNITKFLSRLDKYLLRYGGHHNAAGFTLKADLLEVFIEEAGILLQKNYSEYVPVSEKTVAAEVTMNDLNDDFFMQIEKLEPFGHENEKPIFSVKGTIVKLHTIGVTGLHAKYQIETSSGRLDVLHFGGVEQMNKLSQGDVVIFYGNPQKEEFRGKEQVTFIAEQVCPEL